MRGRQAALLAAANDPNLQPPPLRTGGGGRQVARVLAPRRGAFVVVFGRDCFRGRALAAYLERSLEERAELLRQ